MTEDTTNFDRKVIGKIIQLDYDAIIPQTDECLYCLTDGQVEMILSVLDYFGWSTRWYSASGTIDKSVILALQGDLGARLMNGCCGDEIPVRYRYLSDGTLQRSEDGGVTWENDPDNDPRNNSTIYPPLPEDIVDIKCAAAESGMMAVKQQVGEQLTDDMSTYTLGELIRTWIEVYLQTSNPFTALITIAVNQIFALVIAVLRPALTDDVYEKFKCALYANMAEDASFNNAQWEAARAEITSEIAGIAGVFLEHLVYLLGAVGTTNIVRSGLATSGDCSECESDDCVGREPTIEGEGTLTYLGDCVWRLTAGESFHDGGYWATFVWDDNLTNVNTICGKINRLADTRSGDDASFGPCGGSFPAYPLSNPSPSFYIVQFKGTNAGWHIDFEVIE